MKHCSRLLMTKLFLNADRENFCSIGECGGKYGRPYKYFDIWQKFFLKQLLRHKSSEMGDTTVTFT